MSTLNKHQTTRYRDYLYKECLGSTIKTVSKKENVPYTTLENSIAKEKEVEQFDE
ncbi:transposase family protein [Alkalihalobacillus deserti]|uniref:transposase family protein n=1 Tax=Alkalihalobacillus deserti TaxID=2879466 RepID=UPI001D15A079|nr:transposase family protein [Alkalihalobacillus deserti]